MTLELDVQQGWHDAIIELFDLDLEPITGDANDKFYFTNQLKPDETKIVWQGRTYEPLPIIAAGYEKNTTGQIAQPSLTVANVMGTFTQVIDSFDDLVGAKVTRRRTFGKYLDGESLADPSQEFPLDIFYIERKTTENALTITWQLASVLDLEGLMLPRRVVTQNYCQWKYRSTECGYTGAPVFDSRDQVISTTGQSAEAVTVLNAYALTEQRKNELQVAIDALNAAAKAKEAACSTLVLLSTQFNSPMAFGPDYYVLESSAVWNGAGVSLGQIYRRGTLQVISGSNQYFSIEQWGVDAAACSAATTVYNNAVTARNTALTNYNNSLSALNAAVALLPLTDSLWRQDICGKRVESCQLRFQTTPVSTPSLPFGGFPGAIRGRA